MKPLLAVILGLLAGGCKRSMAAPPADAAPAVAETVATPAAPPPSESQMRLYDALKVRDGVPPCDALGSLSASLATDLVWLAENVQQPAYVGVRAAGCVVAAHSEAAADALRRWVVQPETRGFGYLVLDGIDAIPEALAVELSTLALTQGPDADGARQRIEKSGRPAVRAVIPDTPRAE